MPLHGAGPNPLGLSGECGRSSHRITPHPTPVGAPRPAAARDWPLWQIGQIDATAESEQLDADGQVVRAIVDVAIPIDVVGEIASCQVVEKPPRLPVTVRPSWPPVGPASPQLDAPHAASDQALQELPPQDDVFTQSNIETQHVADSISAHLLGNDHGYALHPMVFPDLLVAGVAPEVGVLGIQAARAEGRDLGIEAGRDTAGRRGA